VVASRYARTSDFEYVPGGHTEHSSKRPTDGLKVPARHKGLHSFPGVGLFTWTMMNLVLTAQNVRKVVVPTLPGTGCTLSVLGGAGTTPRGTPRNPAGLGGTARTPAGTARTRTNSSSSACRSSSSPGWSRIPGTGPASRLALPMSDFYVDHCHPSVF
jgi:hypothetical protein